MNFLMHLFLSTNDPEILTGNLMGDFVKGRLHEHYPLRIKAGILQHRRIDTFSQTHPVFTRSRHRISNHFGLYRGVMVDLFYDHFLAHSWNEWSDDSLNGYLVKTRKLVESSHRWLPESLQRLIPVIFEDLLPSYVEIGGVGRALERMARRVRQPNPLADGEKELVLQYPALYIDFKEFFPEIRCFAEAEIRNLMMVNTGWE